MNRNVFLSLIILLAIHRDGLASFNECNRDCRWSHGFYNRDITGTRDALYYFFNSNKCSCQKGNQVLESVPYAAHKNWDTEFWCGNFKTNNYCVQRSEAIYPQSVTQTKLEQLQRNEDVTVLHCGKCGACSRKEDLRVLKGTKNYITERLTKCGTKFAKPSFMGGDKSFQKLKKCIKEEDIRFSDDVRYTWDKISKKDEYGSNTGTTCMDCWTDNIACDAALCKLKWGCIKKFFSYKNDGDFSGCLKCDEEKCGAQFIKCAGANRRSAGIISDIHRDKDQVCPYKGLFLDSVPEKNSFKGVIVDRPIWPNFLELYNSFAASAYF